MEQQASLLGHMSAAHLLLPDNVFLEFGAGKGKFLHFIACALGDSAKGPLIAIDRDSSRFKADRHHRAMLFERVKMDIENFDLARYPLPASRPVVACGKHLCGAATGDYRVHRI